MPPRQILIFRTDYITFLKTNQGEALYIINSEGIAYRQHEVLYLIKPQEYARWRVMRYSPKGADDMHRTSCGDDMPSLRLG